MPDNKIAGGLAKLLADTYAVYLKTHGYHWNVRGPNFASLHSLFMTQYTEMWTAIDEIAERIRALGDLAPQGYGAFGNLSSIRDGDPTKDSQAMLKELVGDHEALIATATAAREGADDVTAAIIDDRILAHQKHAWMLKASIG
jgi:starvation-inducible DNA-binding protein